MHESYSFNTPNILYFYLFIFSLSLLQYILVLVWKWNILDGILHLMKALIRWCWNDQWFGVGSSVLKLKCVRAALFKSTGPSPMNTSQTAANHYHMSAVWTLALSVEEPECVCVCVCVCVREFLMTLAGSRAPPLPFSSHKYKRDANRQPETIERETQLQRTISALWPTNGSHTHTHTHTHTSVFCCAFINSQAVFCGLSSVTLHDAHKY